MNILLIILLVLLLCGGIGSYPMWAHSTNWGYAPSGGFGVVLLVILILLAAGVL